MVTWGKLSGGRGTVYLMADPAFPLAWSSVTHIIGSVSVQKVVARLDNGFLLCSMCQKCYG